MKNCSFSKKVLEIYEKQKQKSLIGKPRLLLNLWRKN